MENNYDYLVMNIGYNICFIIAYIVLKRKGKKIPSLFMKYLIFSFLMYINWFAMKVIGYSIWGYIFGISICGLISFYVVYMKPYKEKE